jgi:ATP-binding cassette subfamily F protein 3
VSHDRYFVERLATKIVEVGQGGAVLFPGTYTEFLWRRDHPESVSLAPAAPAPRAAAARASAPASRPEPAQSRPAAVPKGVTGGRGPAKGPANTGAEYEARKRERAEQKKREREMQARRSRVAELEGRIAKHEQAIRDLEAEMSAPGFYENREAAQPVIDRHQALMWEVGELMHQWESLSELLETETGTS